MELIEGSPFLKLNQGQVRGKVSKSATGGEFYSFCGIPYAKPPVGELRFKYPQETRWNGVLDATKEGQEANQYELFTKVISGGEDCLFVNIHLPKLDPNDRKLLPVMIHIHGGGFVYGSGNVEYYGPDYLLEQRIAYVTMNYRLGVMGFLCTDPINARGDMGLMDQNLAIKWIKENALNFGGDPNNITIVGISAGSASVEYHVLSEKSKGLFHKVIGQSGSAICPWARNLNPIKHAKRLARLLGRTTDDDEGLFDFINQYKAEELVVASIKVLDLEDLKMEMYMAFVPVVNFFNDGKGFINEEPFEILKKGKFNKVPMLTGFDEKEGIMTKFFYEGHIDKNYIDFIPNNLNKGFDGGNERLMKVYRAKPGERSQQDGLIDFISDVGIIGGVFNSLDRRLVHFQDRQFFYMFSFEGELNLQYNMTPDETRCGASHADEIGYLATSSIITKEPTAEDVEMRNSMVRMWTNFMKFGDPTPENGGVKWKPVTKDDFKYLNIGSPITLGKEIMPERRKLWREIYNV